jgi:hypothetical protein
MAARKNAATTRGRPFAPGNPGRSRGARNRATLAAEVLLEGEARCLTRRAIELALAGDTMALRLCLERVVPPRKERDLALKLPMITDVGAVGDASAAVIHAVAAGEMTPSEGEAIMRLLDGHRRMLEALTLEERVRQLEEHAAQIRRTG